MKEDFYSRAMKVAIMIEVEDMASTHGLRGLNRSIQCDKDYKEIKKCIDSGKEWGRVRKNYELIVKYLSEELYDFKD